MSIQPYSLEIMRWAAKSELLNPKADASLFQRAGALAGRAVVAFSSLTLGSVAGVVIHTAKAIHALLFAPGDRVEAAKEFGGALFADFMFGASIIGAYCFAASLIENLDSEIDFLDEPHLELAASAMLAVASPLLIVAYVVDPSCVEVKEE